MTEKKRQIGHPSEIDDAGSHAVGDQESKGDRETEGDQHPLYIIENGKVKLLAVDQVSVVVEADKSHDFGHAVPLKKTQIDRINDWVADKGGKQ